MQTTDKHLTSSLILILVTLVNTLSAVANDDKLTKGNHAQAIKAHTPETWHNAGLLNNLPNLPNYSGHGKQLSGVVSEIADTGTSYIYRLGIQESPTQVRQWYLQALQTYGWSINEQPGGGIYASNEGVGNFCALSIRPSSSKLYASTVTLNYQVIRQLR